MIGGNDRLRFDNPRKCRRFDNYREPWHVDYEKFGDRYDAIYNGFRERGSGNAYDGYLIITQKVKVDVPRIMARRMPLLVLTG